METLTLNPQSNTTPDPALGGLAVTGNTNTGHGTTQSIISVSCGPDPDSVFDQQNKNCMWSNFQPTSNVSTINLKADWQITNYNVSENSPQDSIATGSIIFILEYSINNGSSYTDALNFTDTTPPNHSGSNSGSINVSIPASTPVSQIRLRSRINASASASGGIELGASAGSNVSANVSNIRLELVVENQANVLVMM